MKAVTVKGVSPAGETSADWESWRQWAVGSLNVSCDRGAGGEGGVRVLPAFLGNGVSLSINGCHVGGVEGGDGGGG